MSDLNRRDFVAIATATCAICTCGLVDSAQAAETGEKAPPPAPPGAMARTPVDVGPKSDYAKDGPYDKFAKSSRILVIRNEGKIYAPTATCSHKNCAVKVKDGEINCSCHGSKFTLMGVPTKGPAKVPLFRYGISVNEKGNIIVDRSKQFDEKKWDDEGASIPA